MYSRLARLFESHFYILAGLSWVLGGLQHIAVFLKYHAFYALDWKITQYYVSYWCLMRFFSHKYTVEHSFSAQFLAKSSKTHFYAHQKCVFVNFSESGVCSVKSCAKEKEHYLCKADMAIYHVGY